MGMADVRDPNSLSSKLRRRRDIQLRALIASIADKKGSISILDMGGTPGYWRRLGLDFLREKQATVTLVNRDAMELSGADKTEDIFSSEVGDACDLSQYQDRQFDLAHSNSVVEHVETWSNMKAFAAETRRVGEHYYVQTPYFWFPFDPHYHKMPLFHWFPRPTRAWMLRTFPITHSGKVSSIDLSYEIVDRARLLDAQQFEVLFPDAKRSFEWFGGFKKSLIAIRGVQT